MEVSLRRWHIALQSHLLPQPSIYSVKAAFEHANVLGLFDCQRGFRRCDLLRSPLPFSSMLVGGQELPTFQEMAAFATSVLVHLMDRSQEHHSTQAYVAALQRLWQCGVLGEMRCVFAVIITEHPLAPGPGDEGLSQAFFSGGSGAVYHGTQSLAFSYREDSSNGTACAANSSEDQVVLLAEHPSISTFLHSLFFSGLQVSLHM